MKKHGEFDSPCFFILDPQSCVPVGFERVGCNAVSLRGMLREIPTLDEVLGQPLQIVRNSNPNDGRDGCASHIGNPLESK